MDFTLKVKREFKQETLILNKEVVKLRLVWNLPSKTEFKMAT